MTIFRRTPAGLVASGVFILGCLRRRCRNVRPTRPTITNQRVMLINAKTGKCLTIAGGRSTDNNVTALQFDCDSDPSRCWRINATGGGVYQISNVQTGKCLTIAGGRSTDNNVTALQFDCDSDPSRTWRITATGGGVYQISNVQTGKCLTIAGGRSTDNNVTALSSTATAIRRAPGGSAPADRKSIELFLLKSPFLLPWLM